MLSEAPLLRDVDPSTILSIAGAVVFRSVANKDSVLLKGSVGEHLMFLVRGRLQVFDITESGHEIGLNLLKPGDYFGELSIIDGLPRSASVVAIEPSLLALLPKAQSLELFHRNPLVAERVMHGLTTKLRRASMYQTILCLPGASQRVFAMLLHLSTVAPGGLTLVEHPPKQHELAIMANTSRETVSRAISLLAARQILEKDAHRLIVRDPEALKALAMHDVEAIHAPRPRSSG